jgi:hypothetical protein
MSAGQRVYHGLTRTPFSRLPSKGRGLILVRHIILLQNKIFPLREMPKGKGCITVQREHPSPFPACPDWQVPSEGRGLILIRHIILFQNKIFPLREMSAGQRVYHGPTRTPFSHPSLSRLAGSFRGKRLDFSSTHHFITKQNFPSEGNFAGHLCNTCLSKGCKTFTT